MSIVQSCFVHRAAAVSIALVAVVAVLACNEPSAPGGGSEVVAAPPPVLPTRILVDLPAGIEVALNGRARGVTPLPAFDVEPGSYTVTLVAGCKTLDVQLEAAAHETTNVDLERAAGLGLVTLEITARNLAGDPLEHAVALDDEVLGGGKGSSSTAVPPCKARVKVSSEGLGGFIEDVDFGKLGKGEKVERQVVLLPGPDMVRMHGGPFTPGTGGERMIADGCGPKPYYEVEVGTFDIDRTEVTVEQWLACRRAGGCPSTFMKWSVTTKPPERQYSECNAEVLSNAKDPPVRPGKENHPMNCIAQWEAEDYCRWAGKRLPTDVEWEFAVRSGRSDYTFPWGNDYSPCTNDRPEGACLFGDGTVKPPCSYPKMDTEQGVCDLANNLYEMVTYDEFPGRKKQHYDYGAPGPWEEPESRQYRLGDAASSIGSCMLSIDGVWDKWEQYPLIGFRCARSTNSTHSRE